MPTAAERLGDFTGDTFTVYIPKPASVSAAVWDVPANQAKGVNTSPNCHCCRTELYTAAQLDTTIANFDNVKNTFGSSIPLPNGAPTGNRRRDVHGPFTTPTTENEYLGKL